MSDHEDTHASSSSTPLTPLTPLSTSNASTVLDTLVTNSSSIHSTSILTEPGITVVTNSSSIHLTTYDPANPRILEDFEQFVTIVPETGSDNLLMDQIKQCAVEIKCSDFHGKGSVEDYTALFDAASKIASDVKQVQLDIDIQGFNDFGSAADELSLLFEGFTKKIQSINIIDDTLFLQAILSALQKIVHLSNTFGNFKKSIVATNTIQLSESVGDTKRALESISDEIQCAMKYIQYFVEPSGDLPKAALNEIDKNVIRRATTTIDAWSQIYEKGVSVTMIQNEDIQYIHRSNELFKQQSVVLKSSTTNLRNKYAHYF